MRKKRDLRWVKAMGIVLFLLGVDLLRTLYDHFNDIEKTSLTRAMYFSLFFFSCWVIFFYFIHQMGQRLQQRQKKWSYILILHAATVPLFAFAHILLFFAITVVLARFKFWIYYPQQISLHIFLSYWFFWDILIAIILTGYVHLYTLYRRYQEREARGLQIEMQLAQAQLQALRMQLQPHFLFNALNTISAYVYEDPDTAVKIIARLSELLRLSLETFDSHEIPLREEIKIVETYLEIERIRLQDRLNVLFNVELQASDALVPVLILQPLAENAIRHGISRKVGKGVIRISVRRENLSLIIDVEDDGPGCPEDSEIIFSRGVGLTNVRERIKKMYGDPYGLDIRKNEGEGFKVRVQIPYNKKRQNGSMT